MDRFMRPEGFRLPGIPWHAFEFQWLSLRNEIDWRLRSHCGTRGLFSVRPYREAAESKDDLFRDDERALALEARLIADYALEPFRERSGQNRYIETLSMLAALETFFREEPAFCGGYGEGRLRWLDAGAKNWSYVQALYAYLSKNTSDFKLTGVELDGFRRYRDFHTRRDYALAFIQDLPQADYRLEDLATHTDQYEVVSCFLPFVIKRTCLAWGLPSRYFQPEAFLRNLFSRVLPGGVLLIVNQGEAEAEEQGRLLERVCRDAPVVVKYLGELPNPFRYYQFSRHGWKCDILP